MGLERLLIVLENLGLSTGVDKPADVYIAPLVKEAKVKATVMASKLRRTGLKVDADLMDRSFKAQLKYANKTGARFMILLGEDELRANKANIKNMATGESLLVDIDTVEKFTF